MTDDMQATPPGNNGDNPNGPAPGGSYDPQYIAVVHLQSDGWNVNGIHAHFSAEKRGVSGRLDLAAQLMLAKLKGGHTRFDYSGAPEQPFVKRDGSYAQYLDFQSFDFGSQHDIYIFFEHALGELSLKPGDLVEISKYFRNGKVADANFAFYSSADVTSQLPADLAAQGSMILIENHFTKKGSQPIGKNESFKYKICLNYLAGSGIAMVIDPDGGNGGNGPEP